MRKIIYKNKIIGELSIYCNYEQYIKNKIGLKLQDFVRYLVKDIKDGPAGYAGFQNKKYLKNSLLFEVFDSKSRNNNIISFKIPEEKIVFNIENATIKAYKKLPTADKIRIFVFPTFRLFVKNKMFSVNGWTPYKNAINIYIFPESKDLKTVFQELKNTVVHEYNHAIRFKYFLLYVKSTLIDDIISEGLAENFRMDVLGGKRSPWVTVLKKAETKKIFKQIKPLLNSKSKDVYYDLFFADRKFPLWTGYTLGYQIVKSFLKRYPKIEWKKIIKLSSEEILKKSGWK